MKNFKREYDLSLEELRKIQSEILNDKIDWGLSRTEGTHIGEKVLYLYEMLELPSEVGIFENYHRINPFIIKKTIRRYFPHTLRLIKRFAKPRGELSRIGIFNIKAGGNFLPHTDGGKYYKIRNRYHLIAISDGSIMRSGDEEVVLKEGEVWWMDNKVLHSGINSSPFRPRIHVVFDILPSGAESLKRKLWRKSANFIWLLRYKLENL